VQAAGEIKQMEGSGIRALIPEPERYLRSMVAVEEMGKMCICNVNITLERAPSHTPATAEIVPDSVKTRKWQNSVSDAKAGCY